MMDDQFETGDDARFDEWLRAAARDVNTPPATPRDAMWEGIQARRAAVHAPVERPLSSAPSRHRILVPAAIAAALLLGIALDRVLLTRPDAAGRVTRVAVTVDSGAVGSSAAAAASADASGSGNVRISAPDFTAPGEESVASRVLASGGGTSPKPGSSTSQRSAPLPGPAAQLATADGPRTTRPTSPVGERASGDASTLYQLAAVQTLAQAEVLLTSWRSRDRAAVDSATMNRLGTWARDVLGSTRLLIDSPAAEEPQLRRLLGDLELVLVQLVQVTGGTLTEEDQLLIDRALGERDLLPRLRTAVPSGTRTIAS